MKKMVVFASIWFALVMSVSLCKGVSKIEYTIYFDTNTKDIYEVKEEIQTIYINLVQGVQEDSHIMMVLQHVDVFAYQSQMKATWENNRLQIKIGDGKGVEIHGVLQAKGLCMTEVKPRSFLKELFFPS